MNQKSRDIAVIGAGISGLTMALRLADQGHRVTVIEGSDQLGGLGTFFEHDGRTFEKFYHCMLPSDGPLLALMEDLGLTDHIYWKPSSFAYANQGEIFPLNTPMDLLRFKPLSFLERLRVGFTGAYGRVASDEGLDQMTTAEWLGRLSGKSAFAKFWQPMLEAKFGDRYADVPALWFWTRFNREKGESKGEVKGYVRGGYKRITEQFVRAFAARGVILRMSTPVSRVDLNYDENPIVETDRGEEVFDQIVVTLPWPVFSKTAGENLRAEAKGIDWSIDFVGVINCLYFLKRPLTPHYWVATSEPEFPFDGVIETSTLTDESDRGEGRHVVYLTKYMHRSDARFTISDEEIGRDWLAGLKRQFPDLQDDEIEARYIFRAPFVEPIYTKGFLSRKPPEVLVAGKIYLATTTQVYPTVTSWNGSVIQANRTLAAMADDVVNTPTREMASTAI